MKVNFLKLWREKFSIKVFITFTAFFLVISSSFTLFFHYQQRKALTNTLIKNSELLAGILAHSVRLGVLSENKDLLRDTVEGISQQENVLEVSVFNLQERLFKKQNNYGGTDQPPSAPEDEEIPRAILESFRQNKTPLLFKNENSLELWSPVVAATGYASEEYLVMGETSSQQKKLIGFAKITIDRANLRKQVNSLLLKSILIGFVFWIIGSLFIFFMTRKITTPLNRLTAGVHTLGAGGVVSEVGVETADEIGNLADAFNTMLDALKKRESEKEQLQEQLRHAQKMEAIGTLAGGIAHDFNNILTAIMGFGGLLQMNISRESDLSSHVEQILESAEKAANLTKNLLAFSRKQFTSPMPLNINEGISNVKNLLGRLIKEDIEFNVELGGSDLIVMADQGQLDQVMMNLVTNARDAMPNGGALTITTAGAAEVPARIATASQPARSNGYALISVSDTGTGINEETREKIFDPFFTTKEVGKGTGLGLSMIYGIVKQHEGYIDVTSAVGKGTTFNIYLPLIDLPVEKKKEKTSLHAERGTETILVADDNLAVARLVKTTLEEFGYKVLEAGDGEMAVKQFLNHKDDVALLLMDVIMPKKNGKQAYDEIKKVKPEIKAFFFSGYSAEVIDEQAIIPGAHFISKPIKQDELLLKIRETLNA